MMVYKGSLQSKGIFLMNLTIRPRPADIDRITAIHKFDFDLSFGERQSYLSWRFKLI